MKIMRGAPVVPARQGHLGLYLDSVGPASVALARSTRGVAALAASALPGSGTRAKLGAFGLAGASLWLALALTGTLGLPAALSPVSAAHAQAGRAPAVKNPVLDGTPEIDASIANHDWAQALAQLDEHLKTHPVDAQAKFKRATVLARMGRDDDAITAFLALTQQYPELPEPYNNLAALYAKRGDYDSARSTLETAISANPGFALGYENLGSLYLKLAEDAYAHATTLDKRDADSRARLTKIHAILLPASAAAAAAAEPASSSEPTLPEPPPPALLPSEPSSSGMPYTPPRN
jgi:tetratricopeptide (TPR) repeat protein